MLFNKCNAFYRQINRFFISLKCYYHVFVVFVLLKYQHDDIMQKEKNQKGLFYEKEFLRVGNS